MPNSSKSSLWADVFPTDPQWRKYFWLVARSTVPFLVVALAAVALDSVTHFPVDIGVTTYEVGGAVLGVFLALRTNSGYERWWEARKLWGGITNQSRSLATAAAAYGPNDAWKADLIRSIILFASATRDHLRQQRNLSEVDRLIGPDAGSTLKTDGHLPVQISLRIARLLREASESGQLSEAFLVQMERDRISLLDHLGGCERILLTPLPRAYTIVIRQFLTFFLVAFPFGILQKVTWLTPLVTGFVAFPMLALDEIGTELQNPFSTDNVNHLPLDAICKSIEDSLTDLLK